MSEWRLMETFPKDGNAYLVCNAETLDGCHQVVFWDDERAEKDLWCLTIPDGPTFHRNAFTHWMELPRPPGYETSISRDNAP
jgi:hypothetical protein